MAVQVTIYLNEADQWRHRPLHMEILKYLRKEECLRGDCDSCRGGFLGGSAWRRRIWSKRRQIAGGIVFVDTDEHVSRVLPTLKEMAAHRLIVRENVVLEQGNLD